MRVGSGHITDKEHETSSSFMLFCDARPETSSSIIYPVLKDMQTERHAMRRTAAFAADSFPLPACPPGAAALRSGPHVGKPRLPPKTSLKKKGHFPRYSRRSGAPGFGMHAFVRAGSRPSKNGPGWRTPVRLQGAMASHPAPHKVIRFFPDDARHIMDEHTILHKS